MSNEKPFSQPNWGGQNPDGVTAGWHQREAGSGKRTHSQHHSQARRAQAPLVAPKISGPAIVPRSQAFSEGLLSSELPHVRPSLAARLASGAIGAVVGVEIARQMKRGR
jgi:hypothetical protein